MWIKVLQVDLFCVWSAEHFLKGGEAVWGNSTFAPDDIDDRDHTHGDFIAFRESVAKALGSEQVSNMTADTATNWILSHTPAHFQVSPISMCVKRSK